MCERRFLAMFRRDSLASFLRLYGNGLYGNEPNNRHFCFAPINRITSPLHETSLLPKCRTQKKSSMAFVRNCLQTPVNNAKATNQSHDIQISTDKYWMDITMEPKIHALNEIKWYVRWQMIWN